MSLTKFAAWTAGKAYESGAQVLYGDRFYVAAEDVPAGQVPGLSSAWQLVPESDDRRQVLASNPMQARRL